MFSGTLEQCFLLGYRAQAREIYTKRGAASLSDVYRDADKGKPLAEQIAIQRLNQAHEVVRDAAWQDSNHYKSRYDRMLERRDFDAVRGYVIEFKNAPPIMCSGAVFPEQDFEGIELQDVAARIPQMDYQFDDLLGRFCYKNQCDTNTTTSQPRVTRRVNPNTPICGSISTVA